MVIKELGQEVDKQGTLLLIRKTDNLSHSPAYTFYVRQMIDLINNKHTYNSVIWNDDECGIIWAEDQGKICGIFCYNKSFISQFKILAIQITAVDKEYRKRGIHTILNKYFEQTAKELGCHLTMASVNPTNQVRLESCKKDGLILAHYSMYKIITHKELNLQIDKLDFIHNDILQYSPAYTLFLKIHTDLVDQTEKYAVSPWASKNSEILYYTIDNEIVGFINYYDGTSDNQTVTLDICYVDPKFRNKGIFKMMLQQLENMFALRGAKYFVSDISVNNNHVTQIFQNVGFQIGFYSLHKKVLL
jgi:GNAT superfamily N-acetyltransferase